jgi:hypothetical protein
MQSDAHYMCSLSSAGRYASAEREFALAQDITTGLKAVSLLIRRRMRVCASTLDGSGCFGARIRTGDDGS